MSDLATSLVTLFYFIVAMGVVYVVIPMLVLRGQPDLDPLERFWTAFTFGSGYWIALCLVLAWLKFHDLAGLVGASLLIAIFYLSYIRRQDLVGASTSTWHRAVGSFMDYMDWSELQLGVRQRGFLRLRERAIPRAAWTHWDFKRVLIWAVFLYAAYLRLYDDVTHYSFSFFDPYVHIVWLKEFNKGLIFYDGVYPRAFHAFLSVLGTFSALEPAVLIRFIGGVTGALLPPALFFMLVESRVPWSGALVGTTLMAATYPFITPMERQTAALPQEFAMLFMLLALAFGARYLRTGLPRDRWAFFTASFVTWGAHNLVGVALILGVASLAVDYALRTPIVFRRLLLLMRETALAGLAGNLFLIVGHFILGRPWHEHSFELIASAPAELVSGPVATQQFLQAISDPIGVTIAVLACAAVPLFIFSIFRRHDPCPTAAFVSLWTLALFFVWAARASYGINTLMPVDRSQTFLTLPICGVAAWLYTLIVEPLFGKAMKNPVVQAGCAAVTVVLLVTVLYTPPAAPKHWQYEEAAKLYHDLVSKLPRGSWTIVGQNEDFELALNEGYHMTVSKFLSDYPPQRSDLQFPTPYMFLIVEKKPMPQPDKEQAQIRRTDEELLLDWVRVYAATHSKSKPMAVHPYEETENVAIYLIYDSEVEQRLPSSSVLD